MAKTLIGNIKGKNGRGITSIKKTGTTGPVDTYTITYTDSTTSTFTVNNSDNIALQRQIVPSAAMESSTTASQAYAAGDYIVVNGALRKAKSAIAKGNTISDSNSTATTVTGELATIGDSTSQVDGWSVFDIAGVKLAIKTITESVQEGSVYASGIYYYNVPPAKLPSGVFASAPTCSASVASASTTCWLSALSGSTPTKVETQRFRLLSSSNETINVSIMITAIGA